MTFLWALVWVVVMGTAVGHINVVYRAIANSEASSPTDRPVRMNAIIGTLCLLLAFFIPSPSYASAEQEIEARLTSTFEILLRELPKLETKAQAEELIRRHIIPLTDTRTSARLMLGKRWKQATPSQRDRFAKAMTTKLVKTYAAFLLDERAQRSKFEIVRITSWANKSGTNMKYTITTKVTVDQPVDVVFVAVQKKGKDWGLVDVKAEGISMALTWRNTFSELIRKPSDIEKVISDLESGLVEAVD